MSEKKIEIRYQSKHLVCSSRLCPQVLMVEVVCGTPCHASCDDRPPGHMGGPLASGRPRSGPDHCGFSAPHWYLHPDGCSTRGYHSAHQTGEWRAFLNKIKFKNVKSWSCCLNCSLSVVLSQQESYLVSCYFVSCILCFAYCSLLSFRGKNTAYIPYIYL